MSPASDIISRDDRSRFRLMAAHRGIWMPLLEAAVGDGVNVPLSRHPDA